MGEIQDTCTAIAEFVAQIQARNSHNFNFFMQTILEQQKHNRFQTHLDFFNSILRDLRKRKRRREIEPIVCFHDHWIH